MAFLTDQLSALGYSWAYRVVDARAFGLPQRRRRVLLLASRMQDPRSVLFAGNHPEPAWPSVGAAACGFYWTEGNRGLGWAVDAIPTLKGGSSLGIPSPPAIWGLNGEIGTPDIRDAERLQGFPAGWTAPAEVNARCGRGARWRLIGNAVPVPIAHWVGHRLSLDRTRFSPPEYREMSGGSWPSAAYAIRGGSKHAALVSEWPVRRSYAHLHDFLRYPLAPLSRRATAGFVRRVKNSSLRARTEWLDDLEEHLALIQSQTVRAA